jgi:excisionase family DNA binding protein
MQAETKAQSALEDDELLTVDELAGPRWLKLPSRNWIYQKTHDGTLPFAYIKVGSYLRFPASDVRRWLESQTRRSRA